MTNWQTTIAGIVAALIAILSGVQAEMDDKPDTRADMSAIAATVVTAVGLWRARDRNKPVAAADTDGGDMPKLRIPPTVLLLAILPVAAFAGCASSGSTPADRLVAADRAYIAVADSLAAVIDADLITDTDTLLAIDVARKEANTSLRQAHKLLEIGESPDITFYLDQAERAIRTLNTLIRRNKEQSWIPQQSRQLSPPVQQPSNVSWAFLRNGQPATC